MTASELCEFIDENGVQILIQELSSARRHKNRVIFRFRNRWTGQEETLGSRTSAGAFIKAMMRLDAARLDARLVKRETEADVA